MKTMFLFLLLSPLAHAAEYRQTFIVNGHEMSAEQAITAAFQGKNVMRCQAVEAKVSKTGTSIGLKNVKRK